MSKDDILAGYDVEADVKAQFPAIWRKIMADNSKATSQTNPKGILLGGQPGAGKSFGTKEIKKRLNDNVVIINGDEFRPFHSKYHEIYEKYGKSASEYTGEFAGKVVGMVRDEAIKKRLNIVIEGTFRTQETPLKELHNFKEKGYETEIIICICPKELSWESTIKRAEELEKAGLQPRYVPKNIHDTVVGNLPKNVKEIFNSGISSRLEIYSRDKKLFDSLTDDVQLIDKVISTELNRPPIKKIQVPEIQKLFIEKLEASSKLDNVQSISVKNLLEDKNTLSHIQKRVKTFKR